MITIEELAKRHINHAAIGVAHKRRDERNAGERLRFGSLGRELTDAEFDEFERALMTDPG